MEHFKVLKLRSTKVEICALRHVAVELEPGKEGCPFVNTKSGISRRQNFSKLGQKLEGHKRGTVTRPVFPGKI